jgi:hypothetical protein
METFKSKLMIYNCRGGKMRGHNNLKDRKHPSLSLRSIFYIRKPIFSVLSFFPSLPLVSLSAWEITYPQTGKEKHEEGQEPFLLSPSFFCHPALSPHLD